MAERAIRLVVQGLEGVERASRAFDGQRRALASEAKLLERQARELAQRMKVGRRGR